MNAVQQHPQPDIIERVMIEGDLSNLTVAQRIQYYGQVCDSMKLNALTKPFDYLRLNGKLVLYANKNAAEQIRRNLKMSITLPEKKIENGVYIVTARAESDGRCDESTGAVNVEGLKGDALANAIMKTETKAKRRATLSFAGLGMLDETEVESIPGAQKVTEKDITSEVKKTTTQIAQDKFEAERGIKSAEAPVVPDEVLKVAGHAFEESEIQLAMVSTDANADKILYNLSGIFLEREKKSLTTLYGGRSMTVAQIKAHIVKHSFSLDAIMKSFATPTIAEVAASDKIPDDADAF